VEKPKYKRESGIKRIPGNASSRHYSLQKYPCTPSFETIVHLCVSLLLLTISFSRTCSMVLEKEEA
jgi:hypothetical protein